MHFVNNPRRVDDLTGPAHELYLVCPRTPCTASTSHAAWVIDRLPTQLYLACSRCAWPACHAQRRHPTERGMLPFKTPDRTD